MNTRVVFGVTSSLFLLYATIKYHLEEFIQDHNATPALAYMYVDDIISVPNYVEEALSCTFKCHGNLLSGGFNLRKLRSESQSQKQRLMHLKD